MVTQLVAELKTALSPERLEAYRETNQTDLDMVINYFWNIDLSEAIVPSLHAFEVVLRNAIHTEFTQLYGSDMWFFQEGLLEPQQLKDFATAYGKVYKKSPPIAGRVVASLMFGFWSALLNAPYAERIWLANGAHALYKVFPYAQQSNGRNISLQDIRAHVKMINDFRNRVFHYEKIYQWNYNQAHSTSTARTAEEDHEAIHTAIKWIQPEFHRAIDAVDSFTSI